MPLNIKRAIQNFMTKRCFREYCSQLKAQQRIYDVFMRRQEEKLRKSFEACSCSLTAKVLSATAFSEGMAGVKERKEDVLIVTGEEGVLNPVAENVILSFFEENKKCRLVYADEDICLYHNEKDKAKNFEKGVPFSNRCLPVLKPIPSPETFLSYNYFGNIWAVRRETALEIELLSDNDEKMVLYDFLLKVWEKTGTEGIGHIPEILYHKFEPVTKDDAGRLRTREEMEQMLRETDAFWGNEEKYNRIKQDFMRRNGVNATFFMMNGYSYPVYECKETKKISILIPSKDNPQVLETCLTSVYEKTTYPSFEVIVIDNGSCEENRICVENLQKKYGFKYIYQPMEFNYSVMNNQAAHQAAGEILLLLNDDMEVVTSDWLERMAGQLMQDGIGAVGAKLLYPDTTLIQHVGVTNAIDGPVHKLLKKDDSKSYNRGRNRLVYNVLGVTGACLMIKKELFTKLGGLCEDLKVAYNDVDLCFSLYEQGLRNVIRNDVVLYHHESLSRGADAVSRAKMERLKWERALLYRRHPMIYGVDPYEGANNVGGSEFGIGMADEDAIHCRAEWEVISNIYGQYPPGVQVGLDYCEKHEFIRLEEKDTYMIQGYAVLPEADNCRYVFDMILSGKNGNYKTTVHKKFRPNMAEGVPNASNVELTGFSVYIVQGDLPADEYKVGIYAKDRCSRQKLFQDTGAVLRIEA